jgi:hypothetical protein
MEIDSIAYLGATEDGERLVLGLAEQSGAEHEFTLHYSKMSRLLTAVLTAGQTAAKHRTSTTPLGSVMPELQNLMIFSASDVQKLPDGNVAARLLVQDVPIDLRFTPEQAKNLSEQLQAACSADPPTSSSLSH